MLATTACYTSSYGNVISTTVYLYAPFALPADSPPRRTAPPDDGSWLPKVWRPHPAPLRHAMRARVHHLNRGDRRKRQAAVRELSARA